MRAETRQRPKSHALTGPGTTAPEPNSSEAVAHAKQSDTGQGLMAGGTASSKEQTQHILLMKLSVKTLHRNQALKKEMAA